MNCTSLARAINILKRVFMTIDKKKFVHGERTAYILMRYLQMKGSYSKYEMAKIIQIGLLHDIGAYKMEQKVKNVDIDNSLNRHEIFGYIYIRYFPIYDNDLAEICLYHHLEIEKLAKVNTKYSDILKVFSYLNLLEENWEIDQQLSYEEIIDILNIRDEHKDVFSELNGKYNIYAELISGQYERELYNYLEQIEITFEEISQFVRMIILFISFRSLGTLSHSKSVQCVTGEIYKLLDIKEERLEEILLAAYYHDIGKMFTPLEILNKPASLTDDEMAVMKEHVSDSGRILREFDLEYIARIAELHHEKLDGSGYPYGLKGDEIPMEARVVGIADIFSALVEKRVYKDKFCKEQVVSILSELSKNNKIDSAIVNVVIENYDYLVQQIEENAEELKMGIVKFVSTYENLERMLQSI